MAANTGTPTNKLQSLYSDMRRIAKVLSPDFKPPSKRVRESSDETSETQDVPSTLDMDDDSDDACFLRLQHLIDNRIQIALQPHLDLIVKQKEIIDAQEQRIRDLEAQLAAREPSTSGTAHALPNMNIPAKIDDIDQRGRAWNLRLSGVKIQDAKSTDPIVLDIAKTLGVDLKADDIDWSHYTSKPDQTKGRQLIVCFRSRNIRRDFISARKRLRELPKDSQYSSVYVNEDLTTIRYSLLRSLQQKRKDGKIHAAWSFQGRLFYKCTPEAAPIRVNDTLGFNVDNL